MAVTTTKTNKPINPRGNDQSPKGYNRAELYSGKALDFDGANDYVDCGTLDITDYNNISIAIYLNTDSVTSTDILFSLKHSGADDIRLVTEFNGLTYGIDDGTYYGFTTPIFDSTWYYAVLTFDGSTLKGYLNGQEVNSINASFDFSTADGTLNIGRRVNGTLYYDGSLANAKIFNTALTAAQVADLYNNPEKIVPTGVANSALKLWLPMQEGAGTTVYDGSADLTDYVTNGDFSDGTNDWTASNATLSVEGGALKITSTGGNRPQGYQTITGLTVGRKYLLSAVARVGTTTYNMEIEISGIGASGSYNKTNNSTDTYIYTEFTATSTTHIVQAKIDDSSVASGQTGYFDDVKLLDLGNYGTISGATWVQGVGAPVAQTSVIDWNKWYLDHSNEVLIPQGLTAGRDLLGNLFENVRKQGALNLDGNSWAEVHDNASLDITSAITLEAWVYWDDGVDEGFISKWNLSQNKASYLLYKASASRFMIYVSSDGSSILSQQNLTNISSGWNHLVGVYDGANLKCYLNGVLDGSRAYVSGLFSTDVPIEIGRYGETSVTAFTEQIAQPRIYNRALTAEEVQRNYNAGKNIYTN